MRSFGLNNCDETDELEIFMRLIIEEFGEVQLELTQYHEYLRNIRNQKYTIPTKILITTRFREILNSMGNSKAEIMEFLNIPDSYLTCDAILSEMEKARGEYQSCIDDYQMYILKIGEGNKKMLK